LEVGHFRFGSIATELGCPGRVRYYSDSERTADIPGGLFGAKLGLTHRSKWQLFDHFVGGGKQCGSCLAAVSTACPLKPVTFAPGKLRLLTKPEPTGSPTLVKTTGMSFHAAAVAFAVTGPPRRNALQAFADLGQQV
jgi:hypothetical protein